MRAEHRDYNGATFVTFRRRRRARAVAEWTVILDVLGEEDNDDKPLSCSRVVYESPICSNSALALMLVDVKLVDPSPRAARRLRIAEKRLFDSTG